MDKKLACTHCDAETWVFRDLVAGMPHVDCPQGEGTWFEPANTGLQSDGGDASQKTLTCGWCGNHRKGELNDGVRCSCGGNSWLICTLGCLEHEQLANR